MVSVVVSTKNLTAESAARTPTPRVTATPSQKQDSSCLFIINAVKSAIQTANRSCLNAQSACKSKRSATNELACLTNLCGFPNTSKDDGSCDTSDQTTIACYKSLLEYLHITPEIDAFDSKTGTWLGEPATQYCISGTASACIPCQTRAPQPSSSPVNPPQPILNTQPDASIVPICKSAIESAIASYNAALVALCISPEVRAAIASLKELDSQLSRSGCFKDDSSTSCQINIERGFPENLAEQIKDATGEDILSPPPVQRQPNQPTGRVIIRREKTNPFPPVQNIATIRG